MKKIVMVILIIILIIFIGLFVKKVINNDKSWKIKIKLDSINVREEADMYSLKTNLVSKGEVYKVIEVNLDNSKYVWYKIKINSQESGWIASERNNPYVKEYNNPKESDENNYSVDYANPVIKYTEDEYAVDNINNIKYDHLDIEEKSKYTIKSKVYIEECSDYTQYWIEYIVTDSSNNTSSKMQKISFETTPSEDEVTDLSTIRKEICSINAN